MRILVLTAWYPPHHLGGYELCCWDVMRRLEARGHEVHVLTSDHRLPGVDDPDSAHERRVRREQGLYIRNETFDAPGWIGRLRRERANQASLRRALDEIKPDVVSPWQVAAMSSGLLTTLARRGVPMVYGILDDWLTYFTGLDRWARPFAHPAHAGTPRARTAHPVRRATGRAVGALVGAPTGPPTDLGATGAFLFCSQLTWRRAEQLSPWRFPTAAVTYLGIDHDDFPVIDDPGDRPWRWRLLYSGRFDARKGIDTAVRALAHLPPAATLTMLGLGGEVERARLTRLATDLGVADQVAFGSRPRNELAGAYADADCFLFPSEWEEPFGLVPLEAMACGTPVIATGVGGSGEFLTHEHNCLLFEPGNPEALATAVRRLAGDPALRTGLVAAGRRSAAHFDVERCADGYEAWFEAALDGFRTRPAARADAAAPPHRTAG